MTLKKYSFRRSSPLMENKLSKMLISRCFIPKAKEYYRSRSWNLHSEAWGYFLSLIQVYKYLMSSVTSLTCRSGTSYSSTYFRMPSMMCSLIEPFWPIIIFRMFDLPVLMQAIDISLGIKGNREWRELRMLIKLEVKSFTESSLSRKSVCLRKRKKVEIVRGQVSTCSWLTLHSLHSFVASWMQVLNCPMQPSLSPCFK